MRAALSLVVAMAMLFPRAVVTFRVALSAAHYRHDRRGLLSLASTANEGKRLARLRTKAEVKLRNHRYREASKVRDPLSLTAVRVSVCPMLREELSLNGREKRGRLFVERGSNASVTLKGLKQELHSFFRALKKSSFVLSASLPSSNPSGSFDASPPIGDELLPRPVSSDDAVASLFSDAAAQFSAQPPSDSGLPRPTVLLHVSSNPNAPPPPPPPPYLASMPDPSSSTHMTMLSFYSFPPSGVADVPDFALRLKRLWAPFNALGRVYVAPEGVNAQMSVPSDVLSNFRECCLSVPELGEWMENGLNVDPVPVPVQEFWKEGKVPFKGLHIRERRQIVADALDGPLDWQRAGTDLPPMEWHERLAKAEGGGEDGPIILDCRNEYETGVGRFVGAEPLNTDTFRDTWGKLRERLEGVPKDREIMTYCTGGIRCVKVGAYLEQEMGFKNVSRLAGGIIAYDRAVQEERERGKEGMESLFHGTNFVFDGRLGRKITDHKLGACLTCGTKTNLVTNCLNTGCHRRMVQCEGCGRDLDGCCSEGCRGRFVNSKMMTRRGQTGGGVIEFELEEGGGLGVVEGVEGVGGVGEGAGPTQVEFDPAVFDDVQGYAAEHTSRAPTLYEAIEENTLKFMPTGAHMVSGGAQGRLLAALAGMTRNGRVLEIGTFTGMATCCFAEGVEAGGGGGRGGLVLTLERDKAACGIARHHFNALRKGLGGEAATVARTLEDDEVSRLGEPDEYAVELESGVQLVSRRVNDALAHVETDMMDDEEPFDLVFVDADKSRLMEYVEACISNDSILRPGGTVLVDNVLWKGAVASADEEGEGGAGEELGVKDVKRNRRKRKLARIMHQFNERIYQDDRVEVVMLPLRDGLSILRKRKM